jgi:hypothetical protein
MLKALLASVFFSVMPACAQILFFCKVGSIHTTGSCSTRRMYSVREQIYSVATPPPPINEPILTVAAERQPNNQFIRRNKQEREG